MPRCSVPPSLLNFLLLLLALPVLSGAGWAWERWLPAERGNITVVVKCKHNEGRVQCYLYASPTYWLKHDPETQRIAQAPIGADGVATIYFRDIPFGRYALSMLHDFNRNNDMDYNVIGMPTEGWGFSNKRPPVLIRPSFQECSFELNTPTKVLNLAMTYL